MDETTPKTWAILDPYLGILATVINAGSSDSLTVHGALTVTGNLTTLSTSTSILEPARKRGNDLRSSFWHRRVRNDIDASWRCAGREFYLYWHDRREYTYAHPCGRAARILLCHARRYDRG